MTPGSLAELQRKFKHCMLSSEQFPASSLIMGDTDEREARLGIYRENVRSRLRRTLQGCYPVIERLVDTTFFSFAAMEFIARHPPVSGCLSNYGEDFPEFLESFSPAANLCYLPDVARLERAIERSRSLSRGRPMELAALQSAAGSTSESLGLAIDPAVLYLASPYPIDRIWQAHQSSGSLELDETLELGSESAFLQIYNDSELAIEPLASAVWMFRASLAQGDSLASALENAQHLDPSVDGPLLLGSLFYERLVVGITNASESV